MTNGPIWVTEAGSFHHFRSAEQQRDGTTKLVTKYPDSDYQWGVGASYTVTQFVRQQPHLTHFFYYQWSYQNDNFGASLVRSPSLAPPPATPERQQPYCDFKNRNRSQFTIAERCGTLGPA